MKPIVFRVEVTDMPGEVDEREFLVGLFKEVAEQIAMGWESGSLHTLDAEGLPTRHVGDWSRS